MKYNKDQWISSFEDAMVRLRPHMSARVLTTIGLMASTRTRLRANGRSRWTGRPEARDA
jgi:hypothetical protein